MIAMAGEGLACGSAVMEDRVIRLEFELENSRIAIRELQSRIDAAYEVVNSHMDCECEENPGECVSCGILRALEGEP